jgi:hypothetical protein
MEPQYFNESLVRSLTPWSAAESSDTFPDNFAFPAYCGSRVIFYGLDSSGFQGINCDLGAKHIPGFGPNAAALNVYHKEMHSTHQLWDDALEPANQMPLGYMTFEIVIDGVTVPPRDLLFCATDWLRNTDLRTAVVSTTYTIKKKIRVTVEHVVLVNSAQPHFRWKAETADGRSHKVTLRFQLKPRTRTGQLLWDIAPDSEIVESSCAVLAGAVLQKTGVYHAVDDYLLAWGIAMPGGSHRLEAIAFQPTLVAERTFEISVGSPAIAEVLAQFGTNVTKTQSADSVADLLRTGVERGIKKTVAQSMQYWDSFWNRVVNVDSGDVRADFLTYRSLQMLTSGNALDGGMPANFQYTSGCTHWRTSTFHDAMYVQKGLLQSNAVDEATTLMNWMNRKCWQPEERPIYWLTRYDGHVVTKKELDLGFLAFVTLGLIPILYWESVDDETWRARLYDMVRHAVRFVVKSLLVERDGLYYLSTPATGDFFEEPDEHLVQQDGFVLLGLRTLLRKAEWYARQLNVDVDERKHWTQVADNLYYPHDNENCLLDSENGSRSGWPLTHIAAFCTSPNDPQPQQAQKAQWHRIRKAGKVGQAWGLFVDVSCGNLYGHGDFAAKQLQNGINMGGYGCGYFSEFFLDTPGGPNAPLRANLPPFTTAHGAYLSGVASMFVRESIWSPSIELGILLGSGYALGHWKIERLRSLNGAVISLTGSPQTVYGTVNAPKSHRIDVTVVRPKQLENVDVTLYSNDGETAFAAGKQVQLQVPAGTLYFFRLEAQRYR